jgi:hypothetical protein
MELFLVSGQTACDDAQQVTPIVELGSDATNQLEIYLETNL